MIFNPSHGPSGVSARILLTLAAAAFLLSCKPADPEAQNPPAAPRENAAAQPAPAVTPAPPPAPAPAPPMPQPAGPVAPSPPPAIPANASPEVLAAIYFDLMQHNHWESIAEIYHPDSLAEFRDGMSYLQEANTTPTAERFRLMVFGADASSESVAALPADQFFGKTLTLLMKGAAQAGSLDTRSLEVIGSVPEGDDVIHVVTRALIPVGDEKLDLLEVVSFKKDGADWKVLMTGKMRNNLRKWRAQILGQGA